MAGIYADDCGDLGMADRLEKMIVASNSTQLLERSETPCFLVDLVNETTTGSNITAAMVVSHVSQGLLALTGYTRYTSLHPSLPASLHPFFYPLSTAHEAPDLRTQFFEIKHARADNMGYTPGRRW